MQNPFELLHEELAEIKGLLISPPPASVSQPAVEIIDTDELCKRLDITAPTACKYRDKGKIPYLRVGTAIRYNWGAVVTALEEVPRSKR